jgi:serine/threonine protein kinase
MRSAGLCSAVTFCHENDIIHNDIKPKNILLKSFVLKLSDFGLATVRGAR